MECGTCNNTYNNSDVIPLSCKCGKTQCQRCIVDQANNGVYLCTACNKSSALKDLIKNRVIEEAIAIVHELRQTHSRLPQVKKVFIEKSDLGKYVNSSNSQTDSNTVVCVHQAAESIVQVSSHKTQTALSFVPNEKIRSKKLKINIVWKKCFVLPVYFLFQSPWIFLAAFGHDKGQESKM